MNRADVALANQSFQNLGESLLRDRMLKQQDRHFGASQAQQGQQFDESLDERKREFDTTADQADRRTAVDEKNADTMALYRKAMAQNQQAQQSVEQVRKAVGDITAQHKAGQISTAEANRRVKMLQDNMRRGVDFILSESGLADVNFQDIPAKATQQGRGPAGMELDRAAAELEKQASTEADPAAKQILLERAKKLRSGIGREDPTQYVDETEVLERDEDGKPLRTRRRKVRADQVSSAPSTAPQSAAAPTPASAGSAQAKADAANAAARKLKAEHPEWDDAKLKGEVMRQMSPATAAPAAPSQPSTAATAPEPVVSDDEFERKLVAIRAHPQKDVNNAWKSIAKDLQRLSPISSGHNSDFLNIGSSSIEHSPESAYYKAITNGDFRGLTVQDVSEFMKRLPPEERGRIYYRALKAAGAL